MLDTTEAAPAPSSTELVTTGAITAAAAFAPGAAGALVAKIATEARAAAAAVTVDTHRGRSDLASIAHKVARSKTALDDMGKSLTEEWRTRTTAVNVERKMVREALDALKEEVRAPLTAWEAAEEARVNAHKAVIAEIDRATQFGAEPSVADIADRLAAVREHEGRAWEEFAGPGVHAVEVAMKSLWTLHAATLAREIERAELVKLRAEAAERARQDAARAAAERQAAEAAARAERDARIAAEAAERATRETEARAEAARAAAAERAERAERAAVAAAARAEADALAAAQKAERDAVAAVEAAMRRIADAKAAEEAAAAAREANKAHKGRINRAAAAALVSIGLSEDHAKAAIAAIAAGGVPAVRIQY